MWHRGLTVMVPWGGEKTSSSGMRWQGAQVVWGGSPSQHATAWLYISAGCRLTYGMLSKGLASGLSAGLANAPTTAMLLAQAAWSMRSPMCHEEVSLIGTHQQECTSVRVVG